MRFSKIKMLGKFEFPWNNKAKVDTILDILLTSDSVDLNRTTADGRNALEVAALAENEGVVRRLLADPRLDKGLVPEAFKVNSYQS